MCRVCCLVPRYDLPFPTASFVDASAVLGWHRPLLHRHRSSLSSSPHLVQLWPPVPELGGLPSYESSTVLANPKQEKKQLKIQIKTTPKQTPSSSPSTSLLAPHHHSWPQCCNRCRSDNGWYEFICPNKLHKWHYSCEGKSDWTKSHLWFALLCVCVSTCTCLWTWACLYYPELFARKRMTPTYSICMCVYHILYTCTLTIHFRFNTDSAQKDVFHIHVRGPSRDIYQ